MEARERGRDGDRGVRARVDARDGGRGVDDVGISTTRGFARGAAARDARTRDGGRGRGDAGALGADGRGRDERGLGDARGAGRGRGGGVLRERERRETKTTRGGDERVVHDAVVRRIADGIRAAHGNDAGGGSGGADDVGEHVGVGGRRRFKLSLGADVRGCDSERFLDGRADV